MVVEPDHGPERADPGVAEARLADDVEVLAVLGPQQAGRAAAQDGRDLGADVQGGRTVGRALEHMVMPR